jgi:hypothetical protein
MKVVPASDGYAWMPSRARFSLLRPVILAVAMAFPTRASADGCPWVISGQASDAWKAVHVAVAGAELPSDCARIELDLRGERAVLTFVTHDGRAAKREVLAASELLPTLQALAVTGVVERSEPGSDRAADVSHEAMPAEVNAPAPIRPAVDTPPPVVGPVVSPEVQSGTSLAVVAGARGGGGAMISPTVSVTGARGLGRWELGLMLAIEAQYLKVDTTPARAPSSAIAAGVLVGRRDPLGNLFVLSNARVSMAALNDETVKDSGVRGAAEARLGVGAGMAFPRHARTRARCDLSFEIVPHAIGDNRVTPWWAAGLFFGVEVGGS